MSSTNRPHARLRLCLLTNLAARSALSIGLFLGMTAGTGAQSMPGAAASPSAEPRQQPATVASPPESASDGIGDIIVTAQRRSENLQQVPITISAIDQAQIEKAGIKTTADLGQMVSNVQIGLPGGAGAQPIITIRGIGLNDGNTNNAGPNGVYSDEVYIGSPVAQNLQVFDLQQVEILKGPQGTLYGRNTSGGAINFISAKPTDSFSGHLLTSYSSFSTFNAEGALSGPLSPTLTARLAATTTQSGGYLHNALTGGRENGEHMVAGRLQLEWKPTSDLTVLASLHAAHVDQRPTDYRHIGTLDAQGNICSVADGRGGKCVDLFGFGTPAGFYDGSWNRREHMKVDDDGGFLRVDYRMGSVNLTSLSAYNNTRSFRPEDTDASPNRLIEINFGVKSAELSQEFRLSQSKSRYNWVVGVNASRQVLRQDQPLFLFLDADKYFGPGGGDGLAEIVNNFSRQTTRALAIFGQGDYHVTDKLVLTAGGRYSDERKDFRYSESYQYQQGGAGNFEPLTQVGVFQNKLHNSAFNYRVAAGYEVVHDTHLYASIASGFKSGGFNGGFLSSVPAEVRAQLAPIRPEHVTTYEGGVKADFFNRHLRIDLAGFYNAYRDMQVFVYVPSPVASNPPLNLLDNAPGSHTEGIDLSIIGKVSSGLSITENLGYVHTRLDQYLVNRSPGTPDYSGNRLPLSPEVTSSTVVDFSSSVRGGTLNVQLMANYKSFQFFDTSNDPYLTQSAYWLVNARVGYTFKSGWEIAGFVRNLTKTQYLNDSFQLSSPFGLVEDVVGRPRSFGAELNYRF